MILYLITKEQESEKKYLKVQLFGCSGFYELEIPKIKSYPDTQVYAYTPDFEKETLHKYGVEYNMVDNNKVLNDDNINEYTSVHIQQYVHYKNIFCDLYAK